MTDGGEELGAEIVTTLALGAAFLVAFLVWENRAPEPMPALRLLRVREFAAGNATAFLMSGSVFAAGFFVAQYFQFARGYSPLATGVRLLPWLATRGYRAYFPTLQLITPEAADPAGEGHHVSRGSDEPGPGG